MRKHLLEAIHAKREGDPNGCDGEQGATPNRVTMDVEVVSCARCKAFYWNQGLTLSPSGKAHLESLGYESEATV